MTKTIPAQQLDKVLGGAAALSLTPKVLVGPEGANKWLKERGLPLPK